MRMHTPTCIHAHIECTHTQLNTCTHTLMFLHNHTLGEAPIGHQHENSDTDIFLAGYKLIKVSQ